MSTASPSLMLLFRDSFLTVNCVKNIVRVFCLGSSSCPDHIERWNGSTRKEGDPQQGDVEQVDCCGGQRLSQCRQDESRMGNIVKTAELATR